MKNIAYHLFLWSLLVLSAGCDEDESAFAGKDNYITRFELQKDDNAYVAKITSDNKILLTIPELVSLEGMVPVVTVSENATITPHPESVTDWSQEMIFRVVSYNGAEREYRYSLTRSETPEKGSVHLSTQAEVNAFAASGIRTIEGSLFIGSDHEVEKADSIVSLDALTSLERVGGNVVVNPTYKAPEFTIENLKSIGGDLTVSQKTVKTLRMPSLETVYGSLVYKSEADAKLVYDTHTVDLPKLTEVGINLELDIVRYSTMVTEDSHISVPELVKVGGTLMMGRTINMARVHFPSLKEAGSIDWEGSMGAAVEDAIYAISFDVLERVNGDFVMTDVAGLGELLAPNLVSIAGNLNIKIQNGETLKKTDFHSLSSIRGDFTLGGICLENMTGFSALEHVGGNFSYSDGRGNLLTSLKGLEQLKRVDGGKISIYGSNLSDVSGLQNVESPVSQLLLSVSNADISNIETLKDIDFKNLYLYLPKGEKIYDLRGFHFDSLTIQTDPNGDMSLTTHFLLDSEITADVRLTGFVIVSGLKRLNGELNCGKRDNDMYQVKYFNFTDLEEVTGDLYYVYTFPHEFPCLRKIGGNLTAYMAPVSTGVTPFPALEEIGGYADLQINVTELLFPQLKTVGGELKITKGLSWSNNPIETMDGFSSLESAGKLNIQYCTELYSYQGLEKAIGNMTDKSQWEVSHNKYNPSYEDVKAGKLVMEK